ncbi:MAG: hypothetical protein K2K70_04445 [Lachnospiraceae bacterium]|nr:hypothetical protein [Lachnospiraceae bacterium]
MRGKLRIAVVVTALALGLAGCGVKEQQKDTAEDKSKADAVIQHAGNTSEERQMLTLKEDIEPGAVLTEYCLYKEEDDAVIVQSDHAGNELSRVTLEDDDTFDGLLCGSDKRIIYARERADSELLNIDRDLYSAPVLQTENGETVRWDQAEKIATYRYELGEESNVYYLQEPYLIYCADDHTMVRHNLETGDEENMELSPEHMAEFDIASLDGYLYLEEDDYDYEEKIGLYRIDIAKWTIEKVIELENQEEEIGQIWIEGPLLYMEIGRDEDGFVLDRLECFDLDQKKTVGQLSTQEIISFLEKEKLCTDVVESDVDCDGLSVYAGKVYITLSVYGQLEEEVNDGVRVVLLRCSENDLSNLENEQEMTEWYYENKNYSAFSVLDGYGDLYYFDYADKDMDGHLMRYHLDTKKMEEVGHDELIWRGYEAIGRY